MIIIGYGTMTDEEARTRKPNVVFVDDIPLGATGKIDKKLIRERMKDYVLPTAKAKETA